jgi:hypothetical protein
VSPEILRSVISISDVSQSAPAITSTSNLAFPVDPLLTANLLTINPSIAATSFYRVPVSTVSPLPVIALEEKNKKRKSRTTQAADLTSTPYKEALECTPANKKRSVARKLVTSAPDIPDIDTGTGRARRKRMSHRPLKLQSKLSNKKGRSEKNDSTRSAESNDNTPCAICHVRFRDDVRDKNGRHWIECVSCKQWFHNACQGVEESCTSAFTCIACDND